MIMSNNNYMVYCHTNKVNDKRYVGITCRKNPNHRWVNGHGYNKNQYFSRAIKKYGWDNFDHEMLAENLSENEAKQLEVEYIAKWNLIDRNKGYNLTVGGEGIAGFTHTEETKKKISKSAKGKIVSLKTRKKLREINKGKKLSEENKVKLILANTGRKFSKETKKKISNALKGKTHSEEAKEKMRNRIVSEEAKKKLSLLNKGKKHTEEAKRKISEASKNNQIGAKNHNAKLTILIINDKKFNFGSIQDSLEYLQTIGITINSKYHPRHNGNIITREVLQNLLKSNKPYTDTNGNVIQTFYTSALSENKVV